MSRKDLIVIMSKSHEGREKEDWLGTFKEMCMCACESKGEVGTRGRISSTLIKTLISGIVSTAPCL